MISSTDGNGTQKSYTYDNIGHLTDKTMVAYGTGVASTPNEHTTYDVLGRVTAITNSDNSQPLSFTYDGLGRMASETQNGRTLTYSYDIAGNLTSTKYPSNKTVDKSYDGIDRLKTVYLDKTTFLGNYSYSG